MPTQSSVPTPKAAKRQALHLFSGPANREDGLAAYLRLLDWEVRDVDIANVQAGLGSEEDIDLRSDALWEDLLAQISVTPSTSCGGAHLARLSRWHAIRGQALGPSHQRATRWVF